MMGKVLDVMVLVAKEGMTMMVVTHEMRFAKKVSNRVIFMDGGYIVDDCKRDDLFGNADAHGLRAKDFLLKLVAHRAASRLGGRCARWARFCCGAMSLARGDHGVIRQRPWRAARPAARPARGRTGRRWLAREPVPGW
jgi:hypothetical protein